MNLTSGLSLNWKRGVLFAAGATFAVAMAAPAVFTSPSETDASTRLFVPYREASANPGIYADSSFGSAARQTRTE